jgi:predicted O-methyltransferase YrrM
MESPLQKYLLAHSTPQEEALAWIEAQTNIRTNYPQMLSGPLQGRLLRMLVAFSGARKVLEIGAFTGYSAACMAMALPPDGRLDSLEINDELEELIREGWQRAGVADKVSLHICDAKDFLRSYTGPPYDLVYIDANKREYLLYYELALPLLRQGGLIVADDSLQGGKVYEEPQPADAQTRGLSAFNDAVAKDCRVEVVMLPLRGGVSVIRKK